MAFQVIDVIDIWWYIFTLRTPRSPSSSIEREMPHGSFLRAGSLKAWKEEQARLKVEEEEREQLAEEKRVKSSQKKVSHMKPSFNYLQFVISFLVWESINLHFKHFAQIFVIAVVVVVVITVADLVVIFGWRLTADFITVFSSFCIE